MCRVEYQEMANVIRCERKMRCVWRLEWTDSMSVYMCMCGHGGGNDGSNTSRNTAGVHSDKTCKHKTMAPNIANLWTVGLSTFANMQFSHKREPENSNWKLCIITLQPE